MIRNKNEINSGICFMSGSNYTRYACRREGVMFLTPQGQRRANATHGLLGGNKMLNNIILIGRLTKDPEIRHTPNGVAVTKFTLAVERRKVKDREKEVDFIDIMAWAKLADICANYLGKGRMVAVEGRLQIRSYDDSQGIRRKAAAVVANNVRFLEKNKNGQDMADDSTDVGFNEKDIPF